MSWGDLPEVNFRCHCYNVNVYGKRDYSPQKYFALCMKIASWVGFERFLNSIYTVSKKAYIAYRAGADSLRVNSALPNMSLHTCRHLHVVRKNIFLCTQCTSSEIILFTSWAVSAVSAFWKFSTSWTVLTCRTVSASRTLSAWWMTVWAAWCP